MGSCTKERMIDSIAKSGGLGNKRRHDGTILITPEGSNIVCAAYHESKIPDSRPSGLIIPDTAVIGQRWIGWVIGVGPDAPLDVEFGDLVELSRWTGIEWHRLPMISFLGEVQKPKRVAVRSRCNTREVVLDGTEQWAVIMPSQIVFKLCDWEWVSDKRGRGPNVTPIGDRVLVCHDTPPERVLGIIAPQWHREWNPLCKVVAAGSQVDDLMPGDWVLLAGRRVGSHVEINRQEHSLVKEEDILMRWSSRPFNHIELRSMRGAS